MIVYTYYLFLAMLDLHMTMDYGRSCFARSHIAKSPIHEVTKGKADVIG